jgi:hypothetical protein
MNDVQFKCTIFKLEFTFLFCVILTSIFCKKQITNVLKYFFVLFLMFTNIKYEFPLFLIYTNTRHNRTDLSERNYIRYLIAMVLFAAVPPATRALESGAGFRVRSFEHVGPVPDSPPCQPECEL